MSLCQHGVNVGMPCLLCDFSQRLAQQPDPRDAEIARLKTELAAAIANCETARRLRDEWMEASAVERQHCEEWRIKYDAARKEWEDAVRAANKISQRFEERALKAETALMKATGVIP